MSVLNGIPFRMSTGLFLILGFLLLGEASAESLQSRFQMGKEGPTVIKADTLEIDNKRRTVTFAGNVEATRGDMVIRCRKMFVYYQQKGEEKSPEKDAFRIDRIVASGEVRIDRKGSGSATAEEAVFYQEEEKVVLSGKPTVKQGEDMVEGGIITLFLKEDRSVVEGAADRKVRAVLAPRGAKR